MSKHPSEMPSIIKQATAVDIVVSIPLLECGVQDAVLGRPPGPRVVVAPPPKRKETRVSLGGHLLAITGDHHAYISDSFDRGDNLDLDEALAQARAPEDLAYALMSRAEAVSIDATWSIWVADELERLAEDLGEDYDWVNCEAARALAATVISCVETQGFSHRIVRN